MYKHDREPKVISRSFLSTGNQDWVGSDFAVNAGVGLVVRMNTGLKDRGVTVLDQVRAAFERDWRSRYAKSLQGDEDQQDKDRRLHQGKNHVEGHEWNHPLSL